MPPEPTRTVRPLDALRFDACGPPPIMDVVTERLRLLGARTGTNGPRDPGDGRATLAGAGFAPVHAVTGWSAGPASGLTDEATVQAATGVMAVHGRRDGRPRGLAVDWAATTTAVLTVQGLLATLVGQAQGAAPATVTTSADRAALLTVSQYLAAMRRGRGRGRRSRPRRTALHLVRRPALRTGDPRPGRLGRVLADPSGPRRRDPRGLAALPVPLRHRLRPLPRGPAHHDPGPPPGTGQGSRRPLRRRGLRPADPRRTGRRARRRRPWSLRLLAPGTRPLPATASASRPLAGLTVLEAGRRIQAPLAAHLLGLLGADVIRVEPPGGDPLRGMPPTCSGVSARWLALNRGKKAVEIDIKSDRDRRTLRAMTAQADVFLHNWAPGKAAALGLDHPDLTAANPGLVYAYTSGWADRLHDAPMGTDFMVQARTGVGAAVRPADEPPAPSLMTLLDVLGALHGTEAVLAGLLLRLRTGHGVRADSSLLGAADTLTAPALRRAARGADPGRPPGSADRCAPPTAGSPPPTPAPPRPPATTWTACPPRTPSPGCAGAD